MIKKIKIADIVDTNGAKIDSNSFTATIGIEELYTFCDALYKAVLLSQESDKKTTSILATLITRIKVAYYYKLLQDGVKLDPITLKGNVLVDGRRRLWAYILNKTEEVEYIGGDDE